MLCWQNNSAETGCWETVVLGSADTTGITATTVVLAEVSVFGCEVKAAANDGSTVQTCADIKMLPFFEFGVACWTIGHHGGGYSMGFIPGGVKMLC